MGKMKKRYLWIEQWMGNWKLWADAHIVEKHVRGKVEGVSNIFALGKDSFYFYFDPRYDAKEVREEINRIIDGHYGFAEFTTGGFTYWISCDAA